MFVSAKIDFDLAFSADGFRVPANIELAVDHQRLDHQRLDHLFPMGPTRRCIA
jgi:hypothetical protein